MINNSIEDKILKIIQRKTKNLSIKIKTNREMNKYTKATKERVKRIGGGCVRSKQEFKDEVLSYWAKYGIKPDQVWYELYCDGKEKYDPRFIPDTIWFCTILPYFNDMERMEAYVDKTVLNHVIKDVKQPETLVKNIAGYYYDGDSEHIITQKEAESICLQEDQLIFKPNRGSHGSGIQFYDRDESNGKNEETIHSLFQQMNSGFVVQRIIKQHPDLAKLNPSTLNTIRVLSFHFKDEVHILSSQLRIGAAGSRVDNVSAGGSACAIYPTGWLHEQSVTRKSTWTDETANGTKLSTICVPNYTGIVETAKRLHCQLPYFNIVGWDFAVGEDGTPILVEFNTKPAQNQIGGREPTFGDLTDEVLDEVFLKKHKNKRK